MRKVIIFLISVMAILVNSEAAENNKCKSPYIIYFSNGVLNTVDDMDDAVSFINLEVGGQYNGVPVSYGNLRNQTGGIIDDLLRVYRQKLSENPNLNWEIIARAIIGVGTGIDPSLFASAQQAVSQVNSDNASRINADIVKTTGYADSNSITQTQQVVHSVLDDGNRVLIVSHSQGNLYSNAVYRSAVATSGIKPNNIKVVGVATPAGSVQGAGDYLTSDSDVVIGALRMIAGNVLPSNFSIPFNSSDISGHLFLKTYMNKALPSEAKIKELITKNLQQIEEPDGTYDWLIKGRVSIAGGWGGTEADAMFIPSPRCVGIFATSFLCTSGLSVNYMKNSSGASFDPSLQMYSAESTKALNRLLPYSGGLSNPDNGLVRLIMGTIPVIGDSMDTTFVNNSPVYTWSSIYYDRQMNFPAMQPDPLAPPPDKTADYPRSHTVYHAKIQDSIASTFDSIPAGKAYLEIYDDGTSIVSPGGLGFATTDRVLKLRICKIQNNVG
ncbi:hypothetical protein [Burkholderia gladioli]|uniref:hypothetical protein n=1 Tax=Burkholderia gladioli TaxID=28095 RepID=UPI000A99B5B1|nr:hypothetical protein [Burkholderia gladioli]